MREEMLEKGLGLGGGYMSGLGYVSDKYAYPLAKLIRVRFKVQKPFVSY